MKKLLLLTAIISALAFTATAQSTTATKPSFNDKSDITVGYQLLRKHVHSDELRNLTSVRFDRSRDEHGGMVGYTYYPGNKSLGITSELGVNFNDGPSTLTFLTGATLKKRSGKFQPFAVALAGIGGERLDGESLRRGGDSGFAYSLGGGVDYKVSKNTAVRLLRVDYLKLNRGDGFSHNVRVGAGIVF